ncbi:hypothetical protein DWV16_17145 [Anaerotruncus sp. AF02-27]|uniref:hypothetical protein n=1 Tax=Anaerotruncus sp. AF02-27 TaxID=2292191 RepID=UPI000E4FDFB3|nr:hypothetical protein [Anaerotruncus sp. AF02-27]RGX53177.1 hypothetical protein DWV16_17145 [Anaerotruncus sp. AF02-27]
MIKTRIPKRRVFNIIYSVKELSRYMDKLPNVDECYKFVSTGGFSSISFVKFVADRTKINEMAATTLRVGRKELECLDRLKKYGKLDRCFFIVGGIMANDGKKGKVYRYYEDFEAVCRNNGWEYKATTNHSKIILMDTEAGKYVLETSSNLNENPKMEQFSFENNQALFDFYREWIMDVMRC